MIDFNNTAFKRIEKIEFLGKVAKISSDTSFIVSTKTGHGLLRKLTNVSSYTYDDFIDFAGSYTEGSMSLYVIEATSTSDVTFSILLLTGAITGNHVVDEFKKRVPNWVNEDIIILGYEKIWDKLLLSTRGESAVLVNASDDANGESITVRRKNLLCLHESGDPHIRVLTKVDIREGELRRELYVMGDVCTHSSLMNLLARELKSEKA